MYEPIWRLQADLQRLFARRRAMTSECRAAGIQLHMVSDRRQNMRSNFYNAIHNWITALALFALVVVLTEPALGQIDDLPPTIGSHYTVGNPTKVPLKNGGYQMVYKNKEGHTFRIIEYAPAGSMIQVTRMVKDSSISAIGKGGKLYDVTITTYEDDPEKFGEVLRAGEVVLTYENGVLTEKSVYKVKYGYVVPDLRTITRYAGRNPEGVTQREVRDPATREWRKASPFAGTTWRLEVDGKQQAGEYTFTESPAITEIRHDSKAWLLMFGPNVEKRNVVVPAESKDHLGFARKLIQLRGNADAGRLEFWLTPDLTTTGFQPTKYALVREDN